MSNANRTLKSSSIQVGQQFGRLVVSGAIVFRNRHPFVLCTCSCGTAKEVRCYHLLSGKTSSCGCLSRDTTRSCLTKHGYATYRAMHPLYCLWLGIKSRCLNPSSPAFVNYGGRGVTVCDEWMANAVAFIHWCLENGWERGKEIDRIDNNSGYAPHNCRFVTRRTNSRNRRGNKIVSAFGENKLVCEWAEDGRAKAKAATIYARLNSGWNPEEAISCPAKHSRWSTKNGS